jgi:AcrR family transcriptional regulator
LSPKSDIEFEKIRKESKRKILDTALRLFGEKGFASTSISMIAKEAGISKGLMYNYFDSKDELLQAVLSDMVEHMEQPYREMMSIENSFEMLGKMIDFTVEFMKSHKEFNVLMTSLGLQKESHPFIKQIVDNKIKSWVPIYQKRLEDIGVEDPETELLILAAAMDGMAVQYLTTEDDSHLENVARALKKRYKLDQNIKSKDQ